MKVLKQMQQKLRKERFLLCRVRALTPHGKSTTSTMHHGNELMPWTNIPFNVSGPPESFE